jgi:hypothetical protein
MAEEQRQDTETDTDTRQRRLKDGTIISSPIDAPSGTRGKKRFKSQDPGRLGCSIIVLIITALLILLHLLGGD